MIRIGRVVKPHGLRGEFSVDCRADTPFFFARLTALHVGPAPGKLRPLAVESMRMHKGLPLFKVRGVGDRDRAEDLRGLEVYVRGEELPGIGEREVYLHELEGIEVLVRRGESRELLGRVTEVLTPGPEQEIWVIRTDAGQEVLFPAAEEFVLELDLDKGRAVIDPPPGLLELYLGA